MQLRAELREKTKDRNQMKVNLDNAMIAFRRRKEGNVYIDKREHIFTEWALYIKKEKAAVNVIGAIARMTLRREVFQRIRLAAREKFLDDTAEREGKSDQDDEERYEGEEVGTDPGTLLTHRI